MKPARLLTAIGLLVALSGCGQNNLPDYINLGTLRVLAMKADQPEVDPSTSPTVTITPVVSDLNAGRTLTYTAVGCIDPGVGYGATPTCAGGGTPLGNGTIDTTTLDTTTHTNTGAAPTISVPIPSTILTNPARDTVDSYNGVAYLVVYTLSAAANSNAGATQLVSFKRIIASTRPIKNTNPSITAVNVGSQSLSSFLSTLTYPYSGTAPGLTPAFSANSVETYTQMNSDQSISTITETLITTWFISDGSMEFYRTTGTDTDTWTPPSALPTAPGGGARGILFVAVTRDGHGGEDYSVTTH